jgi:ABC-type uncharacterized transport system permease subunit
MIDPNFITAILYLVASSAAWIATRRVAEGKLAATVLDGWPRGLLWASLVIHGIAVVWAMFGGESGGVNIGFSHSISLIVWVTLVSYVVVGHDPRLTRLAALYLAPIGAFAASMVVWLPAKRFVDYGSMDWAFGLHVSVAVLAYALYTVAALHALLLLFLRRQLLAGAIATEQHDLPPLMRIESLMFQLLWMAFVLLTATLLSGAFFSEVLFGKTFQLTHKTVFALLSWLVFGGLLAGRYGAGWRGRLAVRWTLIGFVMLLLSYVGSKFVLEVILQRV